MSRTYDGLLRPEADKDPTRQLQFFIDQAAKTLGFNIFQMIEAAIAAVKELIYEIIEAIIGYATSPETLLADIGSWTNQIPLIDDLWDILAPIIGPIFLGVAGTAGPELASFFENIRAFFSVVDFLVESGDFDAEDAMIAFVQLSLIPTNLLARLVSGYVPGINIPSLDASKIVSGQFPQSMLNITAIAAGLITGVLGAGNIPGLDASKIITGAFTDPRIPALDASKVTTGQFPQSMLNITSLAASVITGVLTAGNIPVLDASKVTSGQFPQSMVNLTSVAASIVSGVLTAANIPGLDASKILTGTFGNAMSPGLLPQTTWQQSATAAKNLVLDPAFTDSAVAREYASTGTGGGVAYSTAFAHSGTQSLRLTTSNLISGQNDYVLVLPTNLNSAFAAVPTAAIKVQPGQWFYSEVYVRAAAGNTATAGTIQIQAWLKDSTGVNAAAVPALATPVAVTAVSNSSWTKVSGWYQIPAGYDLLYPFLWAVNCNVANQVFYFDDVRVVEDTQAQAVTQQLFGGSSILSTILSTRVPGLDTSKIISGTFLSSLFPAFQNAKAAGSNLVLDPNVATAGMWSTTLSAGVIDVSTAQAHSGTQSLRITGPTTLYMNAADAGLYPIKCAPGQVFRVGAWVYPAAANAGTGQFLFDLNTVGPTGAFVANTFGTNFATIPKGQWTYCESVLTVAANGYSFNPLIWTPGIPATDVYYVDDLLVWEETTTQSVIQQLFGGTALLSSILATRVPGLDASKIITGQFPQSMVNITAIAAALVTGTLTAANIPGLDASKIITGALGDPRIPALDASKITTGQFPQSMVNITAIAAGIVTGILDAANIPGLAASKIISGTFGTGLIPDLDAAKIVSGALSTARIPGIDASKITSGAFAQSMITNLPADLSAVQTTANQAATDIGAATVAALGAGAPDLATAVARAQQSIDQQIAAFTGTALATGQTAVQLSAAASTVYAQWKNALLGTSAASATAPDVTTALQQQATQQAAQAALTASINAQLPRFYGASGTGGLAPTQQNLTGLASLPAGWTDVACALCSKASQYNTVATTDSQTVSTIWTASDYLAKYLILRANSTFTNLVYAKIQNNDPVSDAAKCEIGYLVGGVKTVIGAAFKLPGDGTQKANQSYTFQAAANDFTLTGPGGLSVTRTSATPSQGASYRYGGFGNDGVIASSVTRTTAGNFNVPAGFTTGDKFDVSLFGAYGGGGAGGSGIIYGGNGGWGGIGGWGNAAAYTWVYGTDIPLSTTTFAFTPGAGGAGGVPVNNGGPGGNGGTGGTSSLAVTGLTGSPKTATGGTGGQGGGPGGYPSTGYNGANGSLGAAPYAATDNGLWYTSPANAYGAPGSPGVQLNYSGAGGVGADGAAIVNFVSTHTNVGTVGTWVFYDSGPSQGPAVALVTTGQATASASYVDLATTTDQVTVVVGPSKLVWVSFSAEITQNTAGCYGCVTIALSGANTVAAADVNAMYNNYATQNGFTDTKHSMSYLMALPNSGATTFKLKYKQISGGTATFYDRRISVMPL